ncbi:hypothetical protein [Sphingosinicella sp. CPCC 101087]|uniref:hypothetical protein n=1 Tax=Sphingosinicella sp. CPCC 101087 TaxID=2497754 RepID=UPI00101D0725|nr:hypothetical protein [Sphingosinicella sp. CPCC 101087]
MNRRTLGMAALALLLAAGALAWLFVPRGRPPAQLPTPLAAKSPTLPGQGQAERLAAARRAAFPDGPIVQDDELEIVFPGSQLVDAPFGPVLVSEGQVRHPLRITPGRIAVHYLRPAIRGFAIAEAYPRAIEGGSFGQVAGWRVSDRFTEFPVIYTEEGGTWQGVTCAQAMLTELTPQGPQLIATVPLAYENSGAVVDGSEVRSIEGQILNVERGRSFDVVYDGSERFTDTYVYRGGRFVRTGSAPRDWC